MEYLDLVVNIIVCWVVFKLGEHAGRAKVWLEIAQTRKQIVDNLEETVVSKMTVEKIGEQYYAYLNNDFIAQASSLDEMTTLLEQFIVKNPGRYSNIIVQVKN